jgi:Ni/Co efflux regulator RcnB
MRVYVAQRRNSREEIMKRVLIAILGTALSAGTIATANAATINRREHHEQVRIRQGIKSGELSRKEAARLEKEQAKIRVDERFARKNGVTPKERARLEKELNRASKDIHRQKHDNQNRN